MITITGGKLTTWRRMAKMTVDRLVEREARDAPCRTHEIPLGQAIAVEELPRVEGVPASSYAALAGRYGYAAREVLALAASAAGWLSRSCRVCPTCSPRSRSRPASEQARSIGDVLFRRTRLGVLAAREPRPRRRAQPRPRRGRAGGSGRSRRRRARAASSAGMRRAHERRSSAFAEEARAEGADAVVSRREVPVHRLRAAGHVLELGSRPWLMGIVNASPDSFSDGGLRPTRDSQLELAEQLLAAGADIIDVGGESATTGRPRCRSSRSSSACCRSCSESPVSSARSCPSTPTSRRSRAPRSPPGPASSTTSAGCATLRSPSVCADTGAALVLMHTRAAPRERRQHPDLYDDVTADVLAFLARAHPARARARHGARAADRRPGPRLRQDSRPDDPAAARARAPARARLAAADGGLAQGFRRRAHRPRPARAPGAARSPRSPTASTQARTCSASTTSPPRTTSWSCAQRCPASTSRTAGSGARRAAAPRRLSAPARASIAPSPEPSDRAARLERSTGCPPLSNAAGRQPPIHDKEIHTMAAVLDRSELEASPLADLHAIADQLGLDGFRRLRKADLIDRILGETEPAAGRARGRGRRGRRRRAARRRRRAGERRARAPRRTRTRTPERLARARRSRRGGRSRRSSSASSDSRGEGDGDEDAEDSGEPEPRRAARARAAGEQSAQAKPSAKTQRCQSTARSPRASSRCSATARPSCASIRPIPPMETYTSPPLRCAAASSSPAIASPGRCAPRVAPSATPRSSASTRSTATPPMPSQRARATTTCRSSIRASASRSSRRTRRSRRSSG